MNLYKPSLYRVEGGHAGPGRPALIGRACVCGHLFFPPQDFGCEKCGATGAALTPRLLAGRGTLVSWATVHMHARPYPRAPFVVGKIALEDGPVMRALLQVQDESGLVSGKEVEAVLVPVGDEQQHVDLWFRPTKMQGE